MSDQAKRRPPVIDLTFERAKAEARELLNEHPELRSERTARFLAGAGSEVSSMARGGNEQISMRLPAEYIDRLEALVPTARRVPELATSGRVTRSDVLRVAILRGLAQLEAELADTDQQTLPLGK